MSVSVPVPVYLGFPSRCSELADRVAEAREARKGRKPIHDWEDIVRIIGESAVGDLTLFQRWDEEPYQQYLSETRKYAPTISDFMRERLDWTQPIASNPPASFTHDTDPSLWRLALNDWPYGFNFTHWVLWSRIPIIGEDTSPKDWPDVQRRGLTAYYNCEDPNFGAGGGLAGAGRELAAFVAQRWPPEDYKGFIFVNPLCVACRSR